jgi:tetratricopeptide (TPR) repeat protein
METTLTSQRVHVKALITRRFLPFACVAVLAFAMACERSTPVSDATAEQEVNYLRAQKFSEQQDFQAAAEFYKKTLSVNPDFAKAHLELGLLSDEKLGDPITAIYHYRRYLELRPDSEKRQLVEDFIERAKLSLAAKLPQSSVADPGELVRLQNDKAALLQENAMLRSRVAELEKATTLAATAVAEPPTAAVALAAGPGNVVIPGPAPAPNIVMAAAPVTTLGEPVSAEPARVHSYLVQKGDTLQSLALRYYGTRSAWEKIYQANRNGLPSKDQLKVGQQLVIP